MTTYTRRGITFIEPKPTWRLLHALCCSSEPLEVRVPAIREALAAGEDPNELGGRKVPGISCPLHYAITTWGDCASGELKRNLPVVELLLQNGADPRLPDCTPVPSSPIEELEAWFREYDKDHSEWDAEEIDLHAFFSAVLHVMRAKAAELDGKQIVNT